MSRSKAELEYIDQRTRQLLVMWCDYAVRHGGTIPDLYSVKEAPGIIKTCQQLEMHREYFDHAITKKWVSARAEGHTRKILASGWSTAKAFLKR